MNRLFYILLFISWSAASASDIIYISVNGHELKVEVADTPSERQAGLMFRKDLAENEGMLFVFPAVEYLSFWMKNTYLPLSIGYFNADRRLVDIYKMKPLQTKEVYNSTEKVMYALEVNQGWFEKHGIKKYAVLKLEKPVKGR